MKRDELMFQRYSLRARQVILVARLKASQRGAPAVSVDDLMLGLLVEDQDRVAEILSKAENSTATTAQPKHEAIRMVTPPHQPFFDSQTANALLRNIERGTIRVAPVSTNVDMPLSTDLERALTSAVSLADHFHQKEVQPLHLLAAAVQDKSSKAAKVLRQSGYTEEKVLDTLRQQQ